VSDRNEFIFAVRADQQLTTAEAMVALVIASYADLDGSNCFTAYETIAKGAKVSVRSAKRHVQTLKRYGLLDYTSGAGRGSNRYVLKVPEVPSQDVVPTIGTTSGTTDLVVPMDGTTNPASGDTPARVVPGETPRADSPTRQHPYMGHALRSTSVALVRQVLRDEGVL
jgi:hypothetical protein